MRKFDRVLQSWRISKVRPYAPPGTRVLDIGSSDGELYHQLPKLGSYIGIEPDLPATHQIGPQGTLIRGLFPQDLPDRTPFDVIAMLAVLEHIPTENQPPLATACFDYLKPGGHLVITVPSPQADLVLSTLRFLRIIDGMSLEQHYGFKPATTPAIFGSPGLQLILKRRFQFGFNNLFVFRRPV